MSTDAIGRYVEHAHGVEGVIEAAATELDEWALERLRADLRPFHHVPAESVTSARICAVCGRGLGGRYRHAKTCSPRCRKALSREVKRLAGA